MSTRPTARMLGGVACATALALAGCATPPSRVAFDHAPAYPRTTIPLAGGKRLVHIAGRPDPSGQRPLVGESDPERTFSEYRLLGPDGKRLATAPSFLSDPTYAGEFGNYYRREDRIKILESATGHTILIVEDRSPTFPRHACLLLRQTPNGDWTSSQLSFLPYQTIPKNEPEYPRDPTMIAVTDQKVTFQTHNAIRAAELGKLLK